MTGKSFLDKFLRGGMVNAFGQTGGLTGLGPKVSYDASKGFVGSNPIVGGYANQLAGASGDFGQQGRSLRSLGPAIGSVLGGDIRRKPSVFFPSMGEAVGGVVGDSVGKGVVRGGNPFAGGLFGGFF